ncbi:MAG: DUF1553 domain-containing protein [Planctomycetes bacterium]|nr:DUF1553 domain-containing protein [Planctomycetota bacterium]
MILSLLLVAGSAVGIPAQEVAAPARGTAPHWAWRPVDPRFAGADLESLLESARRAAGLRRSAPADRATLLRRAHLVLTGLPPTATEVAAARADDSPDWLGRVVADLLASRRHAERQAQHWLDLVRFADTNGFETNTPRPSAWRYRDWLIDSFHRDLPYDEFVVAQLAGDQVGEDAATGFLVAGPWDEVKSPDPRLTAEQRSNELADMVGVTGTTFLAATVGCARCHDHKFDPITQRDFFAMEAVFAGVQHGEREVRPADDSARRARLTELAARRAELVHRLSRHEPLAAVGRGVRFLDDEDPASAEALRPVAGHGENPAGTAAGQRDDPGDAMRAPNLSRGRYSWWREPPPSTDLMAWRPRVAGRFELWVSWGAGFATHASDAEWQLDLDGDLDTLDDRRCLAVVDQQHPAGGGDGALPGEPRWSGLRTVGAIELHLDSRIVLRSGAAASAAVTADVLVLAPPGDGPLPVARPAVRADGNVDRFAPRYATALRFTVEETLGGIEPCVDELRVLEVAPEPDVSPRNVASASLGAVATASSEYADNPFHKIAHANDDRAGNPYSWIPSERGRAWLQIDFAVPAVVDSVEWARDAEGRYSDRLATRYRIEVREPAGAWREVASSDDRIPYAAVATPAGQRRPVALGLSLASAAHALTHELAEVDAELGALRDLPRAYAGRFTPPPTTHRLHRGDPTQPREAVAPGAVAALARLELAPDTPEPARRLALARWLTVDARDVLARVVVNRIWQQHFGVGLVATPNDFGRAGAEPSHPEVLDALAAGLIAEGWSLRSVHRRIVATPTWQQASLASAEDRARDGGDRLLSRYPSRRLDAESIRDGMLAASGELVLEPAGGPGFDVFAPDSNYVRVYLPRTTFGPDQLRRAVYAKRIRMERDPTFGVFDCPDGASSAPSRGRSTTALQAFSLLNSPFVVERAAAFAARLAAEAPDDRPTQVARAFELALQRAPDHDEALAALDLVDDHGLPALCRALFNASEFVFLP